MGSKAFIKQGVLFFHSSLYVPYAIQFPVHMLASLGGSSLRAGWGYLVTSVSPIFQHHGWTMLDI